jgi:hypothetical protein
MFLALLLTPITLAIVVLLTVERRRLPGTP